MITQDEIAKLAREYAEEQLESLKVYLSEQPEALKVANNISSQTTASLYVNFLNWLLRTHCIVSKEKVRNCYNMANSNIKTQYLEACQFEVGATKVLESLFDAETFKNSEV